MQFKTTILGLLCIALCITSCKKWDNHIAVTNADLTTNLFQAIGQRSNLSKFFDYLKATGLDKELASSKTYTVWAPTNDALASLDPAIVADTVQLKKFLLNHIAVETFFTKNAQATPRVLMLNGKRVSFTGTTFDLANITEADKYYANGVLHVIDKFAPVLPNAWEFVNNTKTNYQQSNYILSLNFNGFDPTKAVIDSFGSVNGLPYYHPGTGIIARNSFNDQVSDLKNEDKQYTYFVLNDAAFTSEVNKLTPYFVTGTVDSTTSVASYQVVKDLVVDTLYSINQLPDTLISKTGVKIPVNKNKIVQTIRLSNGVAYVMNEVNFSVKNKIPTIVVQGENYSRFTDATGTVVTPRQNGVSAVYIRAKVNPNTGLPFTDMIVYNHGISQLSAQYQVRSVPSVRYKVSWVAVNDTFLVNGSRIQLAAFNQRLAFGSVLTNILPTTPATGISVAPRVYDEIYIGDYTQATFGTLNMFLTAANSATASANALTLDYIKLVPDL